MIETTIFDPIEHLSPSPPSLGAISLVTYDLVPSQQKAHIRSVLAARKRKSCLLLSSPSNAVADARCPPSSKIRNRSKKKQKQVFDDLMINGLPSPPVDSPLTDFPSLPLNDCDDSSSTAPSTSGIGNKSFGNDGGVKKGDDLTIEGIHSKLAALREEKHRLFQLMKQLVGQEEQSRTLTNQQQVRKKKPSRWLPLPPQQQQQLYPSTRPLNRNTTGTTTSSSRPANVLKPYQQNQSRSHSYFGQQPVTHHHPPYLY